MSETVTTIAEKSNDTENYSVYDSPEPDELPDDTEFRATVSGMYVSHDAFDGTGPEYIGISLGEDENVPLTPKKRSDKTQQFEAGDAIVAMYVSHFAFTEGECPEELSVTIDASASESDFAELAEEIDDEYGLSAEESPVENLVVGSDEEDESDGSEAGSDEPEDESDEFADLVESAEA